MVNIRAPSLKNPRLWYVTMALVACSAFYYLDTIIDFMGWPNPRWGVFYTVHDLHRLLFLIPVLFAAYSFRLKGAIVTSLVTMLVFLPRALFISPYPDALLRATVFFIVLGIAGVLLALQLDAVDDGKKKEELIRGNREFLVKVIESLPYPFYVIDANDYKIKLMNQAASGGKLSDDLHCYALTHDRQTPCVGPVHVCPLEEVRRTQKPTVVEHTHYDMQGNARSVEVHAYPVFDSRGAVIQLIESVLDITEQKRLQENLRLYSRLTARVLESERARISHELYEEIIQTLSAHARQLDLLAAASEAGPAVNPNLLKAMLTQTQDIIQDLRLLGSGLRPPLLDHLGLVPAIRSLAADMKERSGVEAAVEVIGAERRLQSESELVLYRVVEEALRNTGRHSDATNARISVEYREDMTRIAVVDNGKGFSRPKIVTDLVRDGRLGLASMEERVASAGGRLTIESQSGQGTSITVDLPA